MLAKLTRWKISPSGHPFDLLAAAFENLCKVTHVEHLA
jgi:hypothetical protein